MGHETLKTKGVLLAYLLRHNPSDIGSTIDSSGWMKTDDLVKSGKFTIKELIEIVESDKKGRYEITSDHKKIRALQGHSIEGIDPGLTETEPPAILLHGTCWDSYRKIRRDGKIDGRSREYVHLCTDPEVAMEVGKRHGSPCYIKIDAARMFREGHKFLVSKNGVWLTKEVEIKYVLDCN